MNAIKEFLLSVWRQTLKYYWLRCESFYYRHMDERKYPKVLKKFYKKKTGTELNLDPPQTFNEKMQWSKLYDRNPMKTKLADKYAVREWVADIVGDKYLVPLLGVWDNAKDIDFEALPDKFVLKANHGCKWNIIVNDKSKLNIKKARRQLNQWLKLDIAYRPGMELHYAGIKPRIIAEEYLENADGGDLLDYKFFCFKGKPHFCIVVVDRYTGFRSNIYDMEWNLLPFRSGYQNSDRAIPKPATYEEMIGVAEKLSKGLNFVRVDLYDIEGKVYFGEMTFTHGSGLEKFYPQEYDNIYGDLWELEAKN